MDQQLPYQPFPSSDMYKVILYKNDIEVASFRAGSQVEASHKRRALVNSLNRSPYEKISWEEDPRATGWYGLSRNNSPANPVSGYIITIEKDLGE